MDGSVVTATDEEATSAGSPAPVYAAAGEQRSRAWIDRIAAPGRDASARDPADCISSNRPSSIASPMSITKNSSSTSTRHCARRQRVALAGVRAQWRMHLAHEAVEVAAAFLGERQCLEEQIDQERLATADPALQIQPARRLHRRAEQAVQQPTFAGREQRGVQAVELHQRRLLRRVEAPVATVGSVIGRRGPGRNGRWVRQ